MLVESGSVGATGAGGAGGAEEAEDDEPVEELLPADGADEGEELEAAAAGPELALAILSAPAGELDPAVEACVPVPGEPESVAPAVPVPDVLAPLEPLAAPALAEPAPPPEAEVAPVLGTPAGPASHFGPVGGASLVLSPN